MVEQKLKLIRQYEKSRLSKTACSKKKKMQFLKRHLFVTILSSKERLKNPVHVQDLVEQKKRLKSNFDDAEEAVLK